MALRELDLTRDTGPITPAMELANLLFEGADVYLRSTDGEVCNCPVMPATTAFRIVVKEVELLAFAKYVGVRH